MSSPYNGYSAAQRSKIIPAFRKATGRTSPFGDEPCAMCNDPNRNPREWHAEDYSEPFIYEPPASYPLCRACHSRLHKRFNAALGEWELFCLHLEAGGYGAEFAKLRSVADRKALMQSVVAKTLTSLPRIRDRPPGPYWWRNLTLDPESLEAPWARPRPLRPRPDAEAFLGAFESTDLSEKDCRLLQAHANASRRTTTMRQLSVQALGKSGADAANLHYGRLAHRLGNQLEWTPDRRKDGSPIWMSLLAEGWQPHGREYEWTMVPSAADAVRRWLTVR